MSIEGLVDSIDKAQPEDEGCEFCGCNLWPKTFEVKVDVPEHAPERTREQTFLVCKNEWCKNFDRPIRI